MAELVLLGQENPYQFEAIKCIFNSSHDQLELTFLRITDNLVVLIAMPLKLVIYGAISI